MRRQPEYGVRLHDLMGEAEPIIVKYFIPHDPMLSIGDVVLYGDELLILLDYLDKIDRCAVAEAVKAEKVSDG